MHLVNVKHSNTETQDFTKGICWVLLTKGICWVICCEPYIFWVPEDNLGPGLRERDLVDGVMGDLCNNEKLETCPDIQVPVLRERILKVQIQSFY